MKQLCAAIDASLHHRERDTVQRCATCRSGNRLDMRIWQVRANLCDTLFTTRNEVLGQQFESALLLSILWRVTEARYEWLPCEPPRYPLHPSNRYSWAPRCIHHRITFQNGRARRFYEGCWVGIDEGCRVWMLGIAGTNSIHQWVLERHFPDHCAGDNQLKRR